MVGCKKKKWHGLYEEPFPIFHACIKVKHITKFPSVRFLAISHSASISFPKIMPMLECERCMHMHIH